jgi:GR25 family glycosyltransferase involved in LPS biosynthesis
MAFFHDHKHTDVQELLVKPQSPEEVAAVVEQWPEELRNMMVISIRQKRLDKFFTRIEGLSKYVTVIDGIDGQTLDLSTVSFHQPMPPTVLTRGQIGCFCSHQKAWQRIVDLNLPFGFILEDDCDLTPCQPTLDAINRGLEQAKKLDTPWDVLYIGCNKAFTMTRRPVARNLRQVGKTWGLFAYVLTNKAARELLEASVNFQEACDTFVSSTHPAAKIKIAITPIALGTVDEESDTLK